MLVDVDELGGHGRIGVEFGARILFPRGVLARILINTVGNNWLFLFEKRFGSLMHASIFQFIDNSIHIFSQVCCKDHINQYLKYLRVDIIR